MLPRPTRPDECVIVTLADGQRESDLAYRTVRDFMEERRGLPPASPMPGMN